MLVFALDDEMLQLGMLADAIREAAPDATVYQYQYADAALAAISEGGMRPDVVFTDIEMPGVNGLQLAQTLERISPKTNVIFVTGFGQYAMEAYALYPSGYVIKPVDADHIRAELSHLRFPVERHTKRRIRVQCFGNFEAFADEKPIVFSRKKSKELFAYLVDRQGAGVSIPEAAAVLFEDCAYTRSRQRQMQYIITDMLRALENAGAKEAVIREKSTLFANASFYDCDLYAFLAGDAAAAAAYRGEYMVQYSWAEFSFRA